MTVISVNNINLSFGIKPVLTDVSFSLDAADRLGIVGPNGCGKSSLLKILLRREEPTSGSVFISADTTIGVLTQEGAFEISDDVGISALEQMYTAFPELIAAETRLSGLEDWLLENEDAAGSAEHDSVTREYSSLHEKYIDGDGLVFRSRCRSILERMGFDAETMALPVSALSGGQRTRLALSRQLCREPDILMLDEPTNHLDIETLGWLENYLSSYRKCLLVVSHDRRFLDRVTNKTLLIEHCRAKLYRGGYTACAEQRRIDREIYEKHYREQQKEIARQEAYIEQQRRWGRERNIIAAESRLKLLDKMDKMAAPEADEKTVRMRFSRGLQSGNDVLDVRALEYAYDGGSPLLRRISFTVKRNERVFIVGPNGCGKSTLIKLLLGKLTPTSGAIDYGHNLQVGYYDQENQNLDENNTVLEELWTLYPDMKERDARGALGAFLFRGDDVFKPVSVLSGGERARLTLVKLMLSKMNILILDEPTNHLDIGSREALEAALEGFDGTIVCVSHDRAFIDRLSTRILGFDGQGTMHDLRVEHQGHGYDEWQESRAVQGGTECPVDLASPGDPADPADVRAADVRVADGANPGGTTRQPGGNAGGSNRENYLRNKKEAAEARRETARIGRLRSEKEALEAELDRLNTELYGEAASDYVRAGEITLRIAEIEERLLELYAQLED